MSQPEIPLLRESSAFARRLIDVTRGFGDSSYRFQRRVNWSYRYAAGFYRHESECFQSDPDRYLAGQHPIPAQLEDIWCLRLTRRQVLAAMLKVGAHWLFRLAGYVARNHTSNGNVTIYRKAYVDDIELVFDPEQEGVLRAVYPFPINLRRQLRYLRHLHTRGYRYRLTGVPYAFSDLLHLVRHRTLTALWRLETRAQLRHAISVARLGVRTVQLSDEFDIGSLDFCRMLRRYPVDVVNSAHGVGKYFPVHAYQDFHVVTRRQQDYYHTIFPCKYRLRTLNDTAVAAAAETQTGRPFVGLRFVFLSQNFRGVSDIIQRNEIYVADRLAVAFSASSSVQLWYRPHPNCHEPVIPPGFIHLRQLDEINGQKQTLFASFYSTCQIDPAFKGRKILIRSGLIHPEIAFDDTEEIMDLDQLISELQRLAGNLVGQAGIEAVQIDAGSA